jgi:hypothetical protein
MSGLINNARAASSDKAAAPAGGLKNPILAQAERQIEANMMPEVRDDYMKIVVAGMHLTLANGPNGFLARLRTMPDPIDACGKGAVALMLIMRKDSKGVMPMKAGIPAAYVLMLHGLDFVESSGIAKVAEPELVKATHQFTTVLFGNLKITPQMIQHATGRVHAIMQDPTSMAQIQMKAGVTQHPDAAKPTPVPV